MQDVNELHRHAMSLADQAEDAKHSGNKDKYIEITREALRYESEAAWKIASDLSLEPSRSVLFRSAATLAIECNEIRIAEQLISAALAGQPPEEIAEELRDLLEDVYFYRHLKLKGITLDPGEFQMTLEGDAVGFGFAKSNAFVQRVKDLETLLYRTAERKMGKEFRDSGRRPKEIAHNLELYLSVPRAASFAVTLRLGGTSQLELPGVDFYADTMKEVLKGISIINNGDLDALHEAIPDDSYRVNFMGLVEKLLPDGNDIKTVGFTTGSNQEESIVALVTPKKIFREHIQKAQYIPLQETDIEHVVIKGVLLEADATKTKNGEIEIIDSNTKKYKFSVPRGLMSDIVKPMFEEEVVVDCIRRGDKLDFQSIHLADSEQSL